MPSLWSRRTLLQAGTLVAVPGSWWTAGCSRGGAPSASGVASPTDAAREPAPPRTADPSATSAPAPYGPGPAEASPTPAATAAATCDETAANIEGPYYRAGAPLRAALAEPGMRGTPLIIQGSVLADDCKAPIADALFDVWQANADGHYDNDGSAEQGASFLRGRLRADASGAFRISTIVPGRYLNGRQYRPAHVHVKVSAPGFRSLTTQLYFPDDPYNDADPFIVRTLIMRTADEAGTKRASFDFVLRRAQG